MLVNENTDFFKFVNNFKKTEHILSTEIVKSNLNYLPKITIGIPTYNRVKLLQEAIDSALNQLDYLEYDIIIVDNNFDSENPTEQLILSYNNPKISYYKNQANLGMIGNWNRLYSLAKGKWVVMLHDDDMLLPTYLRDMSSIIESYSNIDVLACLSKVFKDGLFKSNARDDENNVYKVHYSELFSGNIIGSPVGLMIKKKKMLEIGGFNDEYYPTSDYCFYSIASKYFNTYVFNKELSIYRIEANESANIRTLSGFIYNDFYLSNKILKSCHVPLFIRNRILFYRTNIYINGLRYDWNKDFKFDIRKILKKKYNFRCSKLLYDTMYKYFKIKRLLFSKLSRNNLTKTKKNLYLDQ